VPAPALPPLGEWETFYVIIGSSGAALTGVMFVVIALGTESRTASDSRTLRAFATPTVVHFCVVLLLAAFLTTPRHTIASLSACFLACAVGGLVYLIWVIMQARQQKTYVPVLSDWIWHTGLPVVAYACLFVAGVLLRRSPETALYVVAATALLLLYIGIHNAWDAAVWMTSKPQQPSA
jgi:hypothetical protein